MSQSNSNSVREKYIGVLGQNLEVLDLKSLSSLATHLGYMHDLTGHTLELRTGQGDRKAMTEFIKPRLKKLTLQDAEIYYNLVQTRGGFQPGYEIDFDQSSRPLLPPRHSVQNLGPRLKTGQTNSFGGLQMQPVLPPDIDEEGFLEEIDPPNQNVPAKGKTKNLPADLTGNTHVFKPKKTRRLAEVPGFKTISRTAENVLIDVSLFVITIIIVVVAIFMHWERYLGFSPINALMPTGISVEEVKGYIIPVIGWSAIICILSSLVGLERKGEFEHWFEDSIRGAGVLAISWGLELVALVVFQHYHILHSPGWYNSFLEWVAYPLSPNAHFSSLLSNFSLVVVTLLTSAVVGLRLKVFPLRPMTPLYATPLLGWFIFVPTNMFLLGWILIGKAGLLTVMLVLSFGLYLTIYVVNVIGTKVHPLVRRFIIQHTQKSAHDVVGSGFKIPSSPLVSSGPNVEEDYSPIFPMIPTPVAETMESSPKKGKFSSLKLNMPFKRGR